MSFARVVDNRRSLGLSTFRVPAHALGDLAATLDVAVLLGSDLLAHIIHAGPRAGGDVGVIAAAVFLAAGKYWGFYRFQTLLSPRRIWRRVAAASLLGSLTVVGLVFLLKSGAEHSREVMALFTVIALASALAAKFAFAEAARFALAAGFVRGRRVVLLGEPGELERLSAAEMLNFGLEEVGRFALSRESAAEALPARDRIAVANAMKAARTRKASEFALIVPWSRDRAISEITSHLRASPLPVRLYPDRRTRDILLQKRESGFDPYISVEMQREALNRVERSAKRVFDVLVSTTALICISPLMLAIALSIMVDSPGRRCFCRRAAGSTTVLSGSGNSAP